MSGRRQHWDDTLIEAVSNATESNAYHDEMVYAIIAAVEDWQDARGDAIDGRSLTEAIFAVQRVREEVDGDNPIPNASDDLDNVAAYCAGYVDALRRVRRALDGGAE